MPLFSIISHWASLNRLPHRLSTWVVLYLFFLLIELYFTWMKCTSVSQRIIWSLWWASCTVSCGCQMGVSISRWKEKQQTQTGSQQAKSAADEVCVTHVSTLLAMNWLWTCAELSREIGSASSSIHKILTQNFKMQKICAQLLIHTLTEVHMALYRNSQIALEILWIWRWSCSSLAM